MDLNTDSQNRVDSDQKIDKNQKEASNLKISSSVQTPSEQMTIQTTRVFVVLNPVSGLTNPNAARDTITKYCGEHNWECEIYETQKNEDLRQVVRDALKKGVDMVIVSGGDGTVSDVVSGMVNSNVPMGILPAGTGNNLARDLSIPLDLNQAMALLGADHDTQTMDVMEVNKKKYYVLNVSVGISSQTMHNTKRNEKRRFGMFAYLYRGIGSIIHSNLHRFQAVVDDKQIRFSATEVMLTSHKLMGLQPQFDGVEVDPNDGRLDMFIVRAKTLPGYLKVLFRFIHRTSPDDDPNLRYVEVHKSIEIKSDVPLPVQADGEVVGNTPVEVNLIPHALEVIVPCAEKPAEK